MKRKTLLFLGAVALLSFISTIFSNHAASFSAYAPKLLRFEGSGYGIHKPVWGDKAYTKAEALAIHRHHYWNKHKGHLFDNQHVAEVLIDHLINAGVGKDRVNVKAFERIIGQPQDGIIDADDVAAANAFEQPHEIVNAYVDYRLRYYRTRTNWRNYPGWFKRAKSFYLPVPADAVAETAKPAAEVEKPASKSKTEEIATKSARTATQKSKRSPAKTTRVYQMPAAPASAPTIVTPQGMVIEEYVVPPKR